MANLVELADVNAWADKSKALQTELDQDLVDQLTAEILARVSVVYDTSSWVDSASTPTLIRKILAMEYLGWVYQRTYSEDEGTNSYGLLLIADAEKLIDGVVAQTLVVDAPPTPVINPLAPASGDVYPNDTSSALQPTCDDPSLGGPSFTMGVIW